MEIKSKVKKFQQGGQTAAPQDQGQPGGQANAQAPEGGAQGGQDPMAQILQVAAQAVQTNNCDAAMAVCQALVQIAQGGADQGQAQQEEPTFAKNGAKIERVR